MVLARGKCEGLPLAVGTRPAEEMAVVWGKCEFGYPGARASVMFGHWELCVTIDAGRGKPCPYVSFLASA